jgi:hypothetical protein
MIGVAVVAFSASIATAVAGLFAWREQKMIENYLASMEEIRETYTEMNLSTADVIAITWDEYVDEKNGYSFLYPPDWNLSGGSSKILDVSNTEDPGDDNVSVIRFDVSDISASTSSVEDIVNDSEEYAQDYEQSDFTIGGQTGILLSPDEESVTFGGIVFVTCGDNLYKISWGSSTPEAARKYGAVLGVIAESIAFTQECTVAE